MAGLEARDRRAQADLGQVGEQREHAAVDLAGLDVVAAAGVDLDALVGQHALLEHRLRQQQDLADREAVGVVAVAGRSCPTRGRSRSTRAASSRRGSASGRSTARRGRPGGSRSGRAAASPLVGVPTRPSTVLATTREPFLSGRSSRSSRSGRSRARSSSCRSPSRRSGRRRSKSCSSPPCLRAFGRAGLANRRCLTTGRARRVALARVGESRRAATVVAVSLRPADAARGRLRVLRALRDLVGLAAAWCRPSAPGSSCDTEPRPR